MAKTIRVPDELYEKAKDLANRKNIPLWKAFVIVTVRSPEVSELIDAIVEKVTERLRGVTSRSHNEVTQRSQKEVTERSHVTSGSQVSYRSQVTEGSRDKVTYESPDDDIDMETFDYLTKLVEDLKHKHGKKYLTESDIESIRDQLINDKNVILSTNKIIEILSREGYIKRAGKKYEITL